jgi:hypothetical protein
MCFLSVLISSSLIWADAKIFSWEVHQKAVSYKVQVCSEKKCKKIVMEKETQKNEISKNFPVGRYFFRMAPVSKSGKVGFFSKTQPFYVYPGAPLLIEPENDKLYEFGEYVPVKLKWKKATGASLYKVKISSNSGRIDEFQTKNLFFTIKRPRLGSFMWSVSASMGYGVFGEESEPRKITFKKIRPEIVNISNFSVIHSDGSDKKIEFVAPGFSKFIVLVKYKKHISDKFSEIIKRTTLKRQIILKKPQKGYYKVGVVGLFQKSYVKSSTIQFKLTDQTRNNNRLSFGIGFGAPKTSLTSASSPTYTTISEEKPENLKVMTLKYEKFFNKVVMRFEGNQTFDSKYLSFRIIKADIGWAYRFFRVSLTPRIGYSYMSFDVKSDEKAGNFLVTDIALPYVGVQFDYKLPYIRGLYADFGFNWIGPLGFANQTVYEFDCSLKYVTPIDLFLYAGYYSHKVKGVYQDRIDPTRKIEDFSQSFSGGKVGIGYEF